MRLLAFALVALSLLGVDASFAAKAKRGSKPKKAAASKAASGGFGKKVAAAGPTPAQLLTSSTKAYEEIEKLSRQMNEAEAEEEYGESDETTTATTATRPGPDISVTKWTITLRSTACPEFSDWVPVAIMAMGCGEGDPTTFAPSALGACVKEVLEGGSQAQPVLRKVARDTIEYAYEPLDQFESHVYEGMQGRAERRSEAAKTLGVESSASAGDVKKAHRKLMMELHPDRFVGDEEGAREAQERMLEVQEAYGELGGGTGGAHGSFYQSIGGKARVSFEVATKADLAPLGKPRPEQSLPYESGGWRAGVVPMMTSVTREFVTRNLMRATKDS